ncbi:MAG TPA: GNAT family N-acetyltransferase [Thermohalobaculum sp.]|nr:GNAT family N-acetyltransferase [Thermohalobaculum sp.]
MAGDIIIRRAIEADATVLYELLLALSSEIGYGAAFRADAEAFRVHGFGSRPMFRALLAERAGSPLGLAVYFPEFSTLRGQPGVYLQDLYLCPDARASGLGRRLIGAVIRDAAEWRASYLRLAAHTDNAGAIAFYERLGFRSDARERAWMADGKHLIELGEIS